MGTDVLARPVTRTAVWVPDGRPAVFRGAQITAYAAQIREPLHLVASSTGHGIGIGIGIGGGGPRGPPGGGPALRPPPPPRPPTARRPALPPSARVRGP